MGIGNTTTSSAVAAVLLQLPVEKMTGRGAGLSTEGLNRKIQAIKKALDLHKPNQEDPIDVLAKVGGFDLAAIAGLFLGGAALKAVVMMALFLLPELWQQQPCVLFAKTICWHPMCPRSLPEPCFWRPWEKKRLCTVICAWEKEQAL